MPTGNRLPPLYGHCPDCRQGAELLARVDGFIYGACTACRVKWQTGNIGAVVREDEAVSRSIADYRMARP